MYENKQNIGQGVIELNHFAPLLTGILELAPYHSYRQIERIEC